MEAGFTRMQVVPLRAAGAYVFDYSASAADAPPLRRMWDETLRLSPAEHSRFVLHKGEERAADTWLPARDLAGRLRAEIAVADAERVARIGEALTQRVRIANAGTLVWKALGRRFGGHVTLGVKVCDAAGTVLREDLGRTPLPRDVAPGDTLDLEPVIAGVLPAGRYQLRFDMVVEGVTWFEFQGSPCAYTTLHVR
jgi:hypothetical protein